MRASPARRARRTRIGVFAFLVLAILAFAIRAGFVQGARSLLGRWEQLGLPGDRPTGTGPAITAAWPPRLEWRQVGWSTGSGLSAECEKLELQIRPWPLLHGRIRLKGVTLSNVRIEGDPLLTRVSTILLRSAGEVNGSMPSRKPKGGAVSVRVDSLCMAGASGGPISMEGWAWVPRRYGWKLDARCGFPGKRALGLTAEGIRIAGRSEASLDLDLAPGRRIRMELQRTSPQAPPSWRLSGEDDGTLLAGSLASFLSIQDSRPVGAISFDLSGGRTQKPEGEIRLSGLSIEASGDPPWIAEGLICLSGGRATLEEFTISRGPDRIECGLDLPLTEGVECAPCRIEGIIDGRSLLITAMMAWHADTLSLRAPSIRRGGTASGPAEISWVRASQPGRFEAAGRLAGVVHLGTGAIRWVVGGATGDDLLRIHGDGVPVTLLAPWLPFRLPGRWTNGLLDGDARLRRDAAGWRAKGDALVTNARISDLAILDRINAWSGGDRTVLRVDRFTTRWSIVPGRFLADSMRMEAPALAVDGALVFASPDSILGLLHVRPAESSGNSSIGSLLRLLGGRTVGLDLGVTGSPDHPDLIPLDGVSRKRWADELDRSRRAIAG